MKRMRWIALSVVVALAVGTTALAAGAQSSDEKPKATDVGITDKEIHVAVIADVDSPLAPNLFKGSVDGLQGWAKYMNSKAGGGGLAGRKVVIDFYDSKLNPAETKNAEITACENDVAAVGTSAAFLTSVDEMRNCKDSRARSPASPTSRFTRPRSCSSAPTNRSRLLRRRCSVTPRPNIRRPSRRTWRGATTTSTSTARISTACTSSATIPSRRVTPRSPAWAVCVTSAALTGHQVRRGLRPSSRATQSEFTEIVQKMKSSGSNYGQAAGPVHANGGSA